MRWPSSFRGRIKPWNLLLPCMKSTLAFVVLSVLAFALTACSRPTTREVSDSQQASRPEKKVEEAMTAGGAYEAEPEETTRPASVPPISPVQAAASSAGAPPVAYGAQRPANRLPKPPVARRSSVSVSTSAPTSEKPQAVFSISTGSGAQATTRELIMPPGTVEPVAFVPVTEADGFTADDLVKLDSLVDQFVAEVAPETAGAVPSGLSGGAPVPPSTPSPESSGSSEEPPPATPADKPTVPAATWTEAQRRSDALFRTWYGDDAYSEMAARRFFQSQATN